MGLAVRQLAVRWSQYSDGGWARGLVRTVPGERRVWLLVVTGLVMAEHCPAESSRRARPARATRPVRGGA